MAKISLVKIKNCFIKHLILNITIYVIFGNEDIQFMVTENIFSFLLKKNKLLIFYLNLFQ